MKKVAVLGSGQVGDVLSNGFLAHGYAVMRATREPAKLQELIDRDGHVVGRYEPTRREVVVGDVHQTLDRVVGISGNQIELDLPLGVIHAELRSDELWIDGRRFGRVEGVPASREGLQRLSALLVALPMLPERVVPADAALDALVAEPPPPPPPPRPRL